MTLMEFVEHHLLPSSEFKAYKRLLSWPLTKGLHAMFYLREAIEVAPPEVQERYRLEQEIFEKLRKQLCSGDWKIVAKPAHGGAFRELLPDEMLKVDFDVAANVAGNINQGTVLSGWRDLNITAIAATQAICSGKSMRPNVEKLVVSWIQKLAKMQSEPIRREDAFEMCKADLKRNHDIHPGNVTERRFRTLFSEHMPMSLRYRGRPPLKR